MNKNLCLCWFGRHDLCDECSLTVVGKDPLCLCTSSQVVSEGIPMPTDNPTKLRADMLGLALRITRRMTGATQVEFAKVLGLEQPALARRETGGVPVTLEELDAVQAAFHVTTESIIRLARALQTAVERFEQQLEKP